MPNFSHLHVHTQFSLLDGAAPIASLMQKAKADNMRAVAMTDHGNMFGAFQFVAEAAKAGVTPIVGCEFYCFWQRTKRAMRTYQNSVHRDTLKGCIQSILGLIWSYSSNTKRA